MLFQSMFFFLVLFLLFFFGFVWVVLSFVWFMLGLLGFLVEGVVFFQLLEDDYDRVLFILGKANPVFVLSTVFKMHPLEYDRRIGSW